MKIRKAIIFILFLIIEISLCRTIKLDKNVSFIKKLIPQSEKYYHEECQANRKHHLTLLADGSFMEKNLPKPCRIISRTGKIISIICPDSLVSRLNKITGIRYVKQSRKIDFQMDSVRILTHTDEVHGIRPSNLPEKFTGKGVLFGIIDADFDIHHPAFLDSNGQTRFIALWDQTDTSLANNPYGSGIIKTGNHLKNDSSLGLSEFTTHGTLMTSFAAGSDYTNNYYGIAPDVVIAGVRSSYNDNDIITGLDWLISIADSLDKPCVINLSIGGRIGPHDGTSLIDQKIDNLSGPGRIIVGAVGNDYIVAPHTMFAFSKGESKGTWAYPKCENSQCQSCMEIWGDKGQSLSVSVQIIDTAELSIIYNRELPDKSKNEFEDQIVWFDSLSKKEDTVLIFAKSEKTSGLNGKPNIFIVTNSTSSKLWTGINIKTDSGTTHVWNGHRIGFKSFGFQGYKGSDNLYTVNEIGGTAKRILTVGAYIGRSFVETWNGDTVPRGSNKGGLAHFSGSGPTVDGRIKPDITAPGWSVIGAVNRLVDGVEDDEGIAVWPNYPDKYGRYGSNTGTSPSSPIVAGIVALMLQADPDLTPEKAKEIIMETAINDEFTGNIIEPVNRWGAGKVNALGALQKLLGFEQNAKLKKNSRPKNVSINCIKSIVKIQVPKHGIFSLYDLSGRCVIYKTVKNGDKINLNSITKGIYTASLGYRHGRLFSKILIH